MFVQFVNEMFLKDLDDFISETESFLQQLELKMNASFNEGKEACIVAKETIKQHKQDLKKYKAEFKAANSPKERATVSSKITNAKDGIRSSKETATQQCLVRNLAKKLASKTISALKKAR